MPDSPRWCARCEQYGDHHTDRCPKFAQAATIACPPCDDPAGHQYDDDRANLLWGWDGPWAKRGDPCIWCDHSKCAACPPPRGGTFAEEHSAGTEECWSDTCQMEQCRAYQTRRATQGACDV